MNARTSFAVAMALAVALTFSGAAAADHANDERDGTTSTGDVDTYNTWRGTHHPFLVCPQVLYPNYTVTLELNHPLPGDRVMVSVQHYGADASVATYDDPVVEISVVSGGCGPTIQVTGLTVSGDLAYNITYGG